MLFDPLFSFPPNLNGHFGHFKMEREIELWWNGSNIGSKTPKCQTNNGVAMFTYSIMLFGILDLIVIRKLLLFRLMEMG